MGYRNALIAAIGGVLACLGAWAAAGPTTGPAETSTLRGVVRDDRGPMVGAVARMQGTRHSTLTGEDGSFVLGGLSSTQPATITAWSEGYLIGWTRAGGGDRTAAITLKRYTAADNPDYSWFSAQNLSGSISCRECMPGVYDEWRLDAHSRSATNPRFLACLRAVTEAFPEEGTVWATSLALNESGVGSVVGKLTNESSFYEVFDKIDRNAAFTNTKLIHIRDVGRDSREKEFAISFTFKGAK